MDDLERDWDIGIRLESRFSLPTTGAVMASLMCTRTLMNLMRDRDLRKFMGLSCIYPMASVMLLMHV